MRRAMRTAGAVLAVGAALAAMGAMAPPAAAAPMVYDRCTGTDHFPSQPVANAPSKQTFGLALDRTYAGMPLMIAIGGASGNQSGSATVGQDGRAQVDVPLFQYGQHMVSSASVGGESIPPGDVVPGGTFTVNDAEQVCTAAQLTPAPAAAPTTTTTTTTAPVAAAPTTTTTAPVAAAPTTTTSTTAPGAAATTSTSTSSSTTTTLASSTRDSTVEAAGVPVSSDDGDDDSILFPALVATGALVALGGAGLMVRGRALSPGGSTTADVTDEELRAAALKEFGTPAPTANVEEDWRLLVHREQQVQQRVEEEVQRTLDAVGAGLGDFLKAVDDYRSTFTLVMSSTTEMQGLLVEWDEVKSIARKQDLAFGIITLAWSGGNLGLKAVKWLRTPKVAASAPRTAADFYKAYNEALQAGDQLAMARLAEEAGVDLTSWVGRFDDAEAAGHALMQVVAERRGWVQIGDGAETLINRLLVNGRSAMSGRVATLAADDLAQLRQLAQQPGFWERLGKAANWVEESARVGDRADPVQIIRLLYSGDDIAFLKALTESGELALLADRVAVGGAAADDAVRTVLLGEDAVRTVVGLGDDVTATVLLDDLAKTQILDDPLAVTRILDGIDDTVILGAHEMPTMLWQPLRNADAATAATQILDASLTAPTVILQPGGLAPTVILGGDDAARAATVLFGDAATAPTLLLNADAATAATHVFQPGALAPTVILNGEDAASATTRMFHAVWEQPTMLLAPGGPGAGTAPTLILHGDDAATAATQLLGNPATMPTLVLSPDAATAATFVFETPATMPTLVFFGDDVTAATTILHGDEAATAATQLLGNPSTMPTLLLPGEHGATAATQLFGSADALPTLLLSPDAVGAPTVLLRGDAAAGAATRLLGSPATMPTVILGADDATRIFPTLPLAGAPALDQGVVVGRAYPGGVALFGVTGEQAARSGVPLGALPTIWAAPPTSRGTSVATAAGIDAGLTVAANAGRSPVDVHAAIVGAATARSRWHRLPAGVSLVIDRLLHATRQAVAGRGSIAPDDVAQLKLWAGRPGFYGELARAADVGAGGAYLKYTEADLLLLQAVERNDGQLGAIREALGPLQVAATRTWGNQGEQAAQIFGAVGPLGQVGFEGFVDQFGITGRFKDGLGWAMAGIVWDGFTSPFQTWHQFRFTDRALDLMEELQRTRSDDLLSLGRALDSAVHALESMQRALTNARLGDPGSLLGGRGASELQGVLDGYRRAFDAAPPGFREAHRGELDDRSGHIRQKLAQLQTIVAALRQLEASLPNMTTWLDALRKNPDGSVRSVLGLFNPEAFVRLGSVGMALGQMVTKGLLLDGGVAAPPPDAPSGWPPPGPSYDFPDDDAPSPEPEEHESTMSDAEFDEYKRTH